MKFYLNIFHHEFCLAKPKCQIKKFKATKHITGTDLLIHENFHERVKSIDDVAKSCKVVVYIKGSYYQLGSHTASVPYSDYDLVIGHGFQFQLRDEHNAMLCNELCLSRSKIDLSIKRKRRFLLILISFRSIGYR